jgi:hypothetical protein
MRRIRIVNQYEADAEPGDDRIVALNLPRSAQAVFVSATWTWSLTKIVDWITTTVAAITARTHGRIPIVVFAWDGHLGLDQHDQDHLPPNRIRLSALRRLIEQCLPDVVADHLLVLPLSLTASIWALNDALEFVYDMLSAGRVRWRRHAELLVSQGFDRMKMHRD